MKLGNTCRAQVFARKRSLQVFVNEASDAFGLVEQRADKSSAKGRDHTREASEISFHSLRHTATTMLKNAGVSLPLTMAIIDDLRAAMKRLHDMTND